jgi:hypothetical protein
MAGRALGATCGSQSQESTLWSCLGRSHAPCTSSAKFNSTGTAFLSFPFAFFFAEFIIVRLSLMSRTERSAWAAYSLSSTPASGMYLRELLMSGRPEAALGLDRGARPWEHTRGSARRAEHGDTAWMRRSQLGIDAAPGSWHIGCGNGGDPTEVPRTWPTKLKLERRDGE